MLRHVPCRISRPRPEPARRRARPGGRPGEAGRRRRRPGQERSDRGGQARPAALPRRAFARLAAAKDEAEANGIANLIERRWSRSGSDTADLLLSRATEAIHKKEFPVAVELLDRVLALEPQWAEAWNRRATAFYLLEIRRAPWRTSAR
jgi:tetratricopeptide (TPR) repeat protein